MKKFNYFLLSLLFLFVLTGCATHEKFVKKQDAWVGKNIQTFISANGYPDRTMDLPNKNKVYVYEESRIYSTPSVSFGFGGMMGPYGYYGRYPMGGFATEVVQESCKLFLETNRKGKIVKWGAKGNDCRSN